MSSFLNEDQKTWKAIACKFAEEEVAPRAAEASQPDSELFFREMGKRMAELNFYRIVAPKEVGGLGLPLTTLMVVEEEVGKVCPTLGNHLLLQASASMGLLSMQETADKWYPKVLSGDAVSAGTMVDPKGIANITEWDDLAVRDGEDFILNGKRLLLSSYYADIIFFYGLCDGNMWGFAVEPDTLGLSRTLVRKMGMGPYFADYEFHNVRIPKSHAFDCSGVAKDRRLQDNALTSVVSTLNLSAVMLGLAEGVLEKTIRFLNKKTINGKPAASRQDLQVRIVKMQIEVEKLRAFIYNTAQLSDEGRGDNMMEHMVKVAAGETCVDIARQCMELHGGRGYREDVGIECYLRDAMGCAIADSTADMHYSTIAYKMGLPGAELGAP